MVPPTTTPKFVHVLIPGTCECGLIWGEKMVFADVIKDLEMRSSSWITWVSPNSNGKCPCKRKADGDLI